MQNSDAKRLKKNWNLVVYTSQLLCLALENIFGTAAVILIEQFNVVCVCRLPVKLSRQQIQYMRLF